MKNTVTPILLLFGVIFLSCCCDEPCRTSITYKVTGITMNEVQVDFYDEYGYVDRAASVRLPWEKTFYVQYLGDADYGGNHPGNKFTAHVTAATPNPASRIKVLIYLNGELVKTDSTTQTKMRASAYYLVHL